MPNVSIFDLVGQGRPKRKTKKKAKKKGSTSWGTPREKYRRLCLHAQLCRYVYHVHNTSLVPDDAYDRLERAILAIEDDNREVMEHRYSPTCRQGSDKEEDYPQSVRLMWRFSNEGLHRYFKEVMEGAIASACEAFGVKIV